MHCLVKAQNPGHTGAWRAGRHFPNGVAHRLEVVDGDVKVDANGNGPLTEDGKPDMTRITRAGFDALKVDPRFSVLADNETSTSVASDLLSAVKRQLAEKSKLVDDLTVENERLKLELAEAKKAAAPKVEEHPAEPADPKADPKAKAKK